MYYCKIYSYKCHVPYLKGGFSLIGLPEGIPFKKPYNYGAYQTKNIIESVFCSFILFHQRKIRTDTQSRYIIIIIKLRKWDKTCSS